MGGAQSQPPPPPVWYSIGWAGLLCDPYIKGTSLEGGSLAESAELLSELLGEVPTQRLTLWNEETLRKLEELREALQATAGLAQFAATKLKDPEALGALVESWQQAINFIEPGGYALLPWGWADGLGVDNHAVLLVERPASATPNVGEAAGAGIVTVTVFNAGESGEYHLCSPTPSKLLRKPIRLAEVPLDRLLDPAFLAVLVSQRVAHETHRGEVAYDVLLPWLAGAELGEKLPACEAEALEYRTPARSRTTSWRSLAEAARTALRLRGASGPALKQLFLWLRRQLLSRARLELEDVGGLTPEKIRAELERLPLVGGANAQANLLGDPAIECIGLYFSGHFCPPCRGFTPTLRNAYNALRDGARRFEVVFVSADRGQQDYDQYFAEMPWLAIPYGNAAIGRLNRLFKVEGVPTLVLLRPDGSIINMDGRGAVAQDPEGNNFPWVAPPAEADEPQGISGSARKILSVGCRQVARSALKSVAAGRLDPREMETIQADIARVEELAAALAPKEKPLPPSARPDMAAQEVPYQGFDLLKGTGEDKFRGSKVVPPPPPLANLMELPTRDEITSLAAGLDAIAKCQRICDKLLARARDTGGGAGATSTSRLAIQGQVIALIQHLFAEVLPMPLPPSEAATGACVWTVMTPTRDTQLSGLRSIYSLMHLLGEMWQDVEDTPRQEECARANAACCALAVFDALLRQQASDEPLVLSVMLSEDGGRALSTGVGKSRQGLDLQRASEWLELPTPGQARARADAVAYLSAIRRGTQSAIFDMPLHPHGEAGLVIELEKYGSTAMFLQQLLERCNLPIFPEGQRPRTEMDSLMMWFGTYPNQESGHRQLAQEHPEWPLTRDVCTLFKFLYSMLPMIQENMQIRKEATSFRGRLPLSFDPGAGRTGGRQMMRELYWDIVTVRGQQHHIADIVVMSYSVRKLTWGDGKPLRSPADAGRLLERSGFSITEEDILHARSNDLNKARFNGTLSNEEAEALLTYLVAPYVRLPLVSHFFADLQPDPVSGAMRCGNRASFLFNENLQQLFSAVLFEQGVWVPESLKGLITRVPMRRTTLQKEQYRQLLDKDARMTAEAVTLGAPMGMLLNELTCSPGATLNPLLELFRYIEEVAHTSVHSPSAGFVLFLVRLGSTVEIYARSSPSPPALIEELGSQLRGCVLAAIDAWIDDARDELSSDEKRRGNLPTLAVLHAHRALLIAPLIIAGVVDGKTASEFLGSLAYVRGHHSYGQTLRNAELTAEQQADTNLVEKTLLAQLTNFLQSQGIDTSKVETSALKQYITGQPVWFVHEGQCIKVPLAGLSERSKGFAAPPAEVPEQDIARALQSARVPLIGFLEALPQGELDRILSDVTRLALGDTHEVPHANWKKVDGHPGLYNVPDEGIIVDAQSGEILYQSAELRPVPDSMSSFADFELIFGREALQCAFRYTHENRRWVNIIGEEHELLEWSAPQIDEQGIGAPSPLPSIAFPEESVGPAAEDLLAALQELTVVGGGEGEAGAERRAMQAIEGKTAIGIHFSAHWCPPCRGFTPKLRRAYEAMRAQGNQEFEVIFSSADRDQGGFEEYFREMPWLAVPFANGEMRKRLSDLFQVRGIPTLMIITPAGHTITMDGVAKISENPTGAGFPWGSTEPVPATQAADNAITYNGVRYARPFVWYFPGKVFPKPAPPPEPTEEWAVKLLQPILEAVFPCCPPDKKMTYILYMPEEPLPADADRMMLIGMSDESKEWATWKEVELSRRWGSVQVYNLVSHGRRMYRTLVWASDGAATLQTMRPMHLTPSCCPIPSIILDAAGDWKRKRMPDPSLVIARMNREVGGRETLIPPRLLAGVVPGALVEAHQFWQGEDLILRGYPRNAQDEWFYYALEIRISPAGTVILRRDPQNVARMLDAQALPAQSLIRSMSAAKKMANKFLKRSVSAKKRADATSDVQAEAAPSAPVLSRSVSRSARTAPLTEMGFSEEQAVAALDACKGPDGRENYELATAILLEGADEMPAGQPAAASEPAAAHMPPHPTLERHTSAYGGVMGGGDKRSEERQLNIAKGEYYLFDLCGAPANSPLGRLAAVFARVEDLGHILVWGSSATAKSSRRIAMIELPRLRLRFQPKDMADGSVRMYSVDNAGWFLAETGTAADGEKATGPRAAALATLLAGIPGCLLLENDARELQVLLPAWEIRRPKEKGEPFGTHLIYNRGCEGWPEIFAGARCFLYPVHASCTFLQPRSLDALLYLTLRRLYSRQYEAAHRLAMSVVVDVEFTPQERWVFEQFRHLQDEHPDATALRLRLMIAVRFGEDSPLWEPHDEFDSYVRKLPHVTAGCQLTMDEERELVQLCKSQTPLTKLRSAWLKAPQDELKRPVLAVGGRPWWRVTTASKEMVEQAQELSRYKFQHPCEDGGGVLRDPEALTIIFESLLTDDTESGSTRALGFIFLYMLATKQLRVEIGGRECTSAMAQVLGKILHLKLAHWGKAAEGTEQEAKFSQQAAILSLVFDQPDAGWPAVPMPFGYVDGVPPHIAAKVAEILEKGVDVNNLQVDLEGAAPPPEERRQARAKARAKAPMQRRQEELKKSTLRQLKQIAGEKGIAPDVIEAVDDADDPKQSVIDIVLQSEAEALQVEATAQAAPELGGGDESLSGLGFDTFGDDENLVSAYALWGWHDDLRRTLKRVLAFRRTDLARDYKRTTFNVAVATAERLGLPGPVVPPPLAAVGPVQPSNMTNNAIALRTFGPGVEGLSFSEEQLRIFSTAPLLGLPKFAGLVVSADKDAKGVGPGRKLPFPIKDHPNASAAVSKDMLDRLEEDMVVYADMQDAKETLHLKSIGPEEQARVLGGDENAQKEALDAVAKLKSLLQATYDEDLNFVERAMRAVRTWATSVPRNDADDEAMRASKANTMLRRAGGLAALPTHELLATIALSTTASEDLVALNPFLEAPQDLLALIGAAQLHTNRLSQGARALTALEALRKELARKPVASELAARAPKLRHLAAGVIAQLAARRFCLEADGKADPRFLVFEYHFEMLLRMRQVQMVDDLKNRALNNFSSCQQMIMGAGKTTVVGPLLALCLADGKKLVMQTMPSALLEMSRNVLRSVFASLLPKRVYTIVFDRSQNDATAPLTILDKLQLAVKHCGVVVAAPEVIKSFVLKMIELLHILEEQSPSRTEAIEEQKRGGARAVRQRLDALEEAKERAYVADTVAAVLQIWRNDTVLVMDEVDVLLHPLRSELNFPIGDKRPIDLSGERWELPMFLLGFFFVEQLERDLAIESDMDKAVWTPAEEKAGETRQAVLQDVKAALKAGREKYAVLDQPHLVLLDSGFFFSAIAPVAARGCVLWLHRACNEDLLDMGITNAQVISYLTGAGDFPADAHKAAPETKKLINLAGEWVQSFLLHCLSKINRVAYGLLGEFDRQPPSAPESRRLMAVPFLAKDVPSTNSEFAHPDVLIGLTVLAYRYEYLRSDDMRRIAKQLKADFSRQIGAKSRRPAHLLFEKWKVRGRAAWQAPGGGGAEGAPPPTVLQMDLFQPEDSSHIESLRRLVGNMPEVIAHYLRGLVFPETMAFQRLKVSACGHELGSSMLFSKRIGFSGTPSSLLPLDLAPCKYEPGSDGQIVAVLTDPRVVSASEVPRGWDARTLLSQVATAEPPYHALIDTGALVTGMENLEVAEALLEDLPAWFEGVVYLDKSDRQMILLRASGRSVPLNQCGAPWDRRFTFYDQIHTTGMDIKQASNARAAVTIGKDMVFRDYSQGAWRMRGIGVGQNITLFLIPEVMRRIEQELAAVPGLHSGRWELDVPAWLLVNSMRSEGLQSIQLAFQELANVYRKRAIRLLVDDAATAGLVADPELRAGRFASQTAEASALSASIQIFREEISHDVDMDPPNKNLTFTDVVNEKIAGFDKFSTELGITPDDRARIEEVLNGHTGSSSEEIAAVGGGLDTTRTQEQERSQQQEQMKEREQEEEEMAQFCRDNEEPVPWKCKILVSSANTGAAEAAVVAATEAGKDFPFGELVVGDNAFYPLSLFRICKDSPALPFPRNVLLSSNYFRPSWAGLGDRRLKNISMVLEWRGSTASESDRYLAVLSLTEAETVRRAIHNGEYGVFDSTGLKTERKPLDAPLALRTLSGHRVDATATFTEGKADDLAPWLQCLRFFHGEMFYSDADLKALMTCLAAAPHSDREKFFAEGLRRRRRERKEWGDTPVARVFVEESRWAELRPRALLEKARSNLHSNYLYVKTQRKRAGELENVMALASDANAPEELQEQGIQAEVELEELMASVSNYPENAEAAFKRFDKDSDGFIKRPELAEMLKQLGVVASAVETAEVMKLCKEMTQSSQDPQLTPEDFVVIFGMEDKPEPEEGSEARGPWMCGNPRCFAWNNPDLFNLPDAAICVYCQEEPRPDLKQQGILQAAGPPKGQWECNQCHFYNPENLHFCEICNYAKGSVSVRNQEEYME